MDVVGGATSRGGGVCGVNTLLQTNSHDHINYLATPITGSTRAPHTRPPPAGACTSTSLWLSKTVSRGGAAGAAAKIKEYF